MAWIRLFPPNAITISQVIPPYIIYIDEAGDPGIKRYSSGDPRFEWFTLGAVVVRAADEPQIVEWIRESLIGAKGRQTPVLHYRNLTEGAKLAVCEGLGAKPARAFALASHKTNMRRHLNPRLSTEERASRFYNWCVRFLLERVTEWCAAQSILEFGEKRPAQLIFSHRGGHNYSMMLWYLFDKLRWQEESGQLFLGRPVIRGMLRKDLTTVEPHERYAGLQFADVVASAFFAAANTALPTHNLEPAKALRRIVARRPPRGAKANFGLTMLPLPEQGGVPEVDRGIFRFYGFET
ncbi:DUF3800 domain-containing protein [Sphingomonas sp.]